MFEHEMKVCLNDYLQYFNDYLHLYMNDVDGIAHRAKSGMPFCVSPLIPSQFSLSRNVSWSYPGQGVTGKDSGT